MTRLSVNRIRTGLFAAIVLIIAAPAAAQPVAVDRVLVEKAARRLTLLDAQGRVLRVFHGIQLGWTPLGPKHFLGDGRTPEGHYRIDWGKEDSAYHLALHVSYPSAEDRAFAARQRRDPGGAIFVHGQPNGMARRPQGDWTDGCIALSNAEIEELWTTVGDGTPIDIEP